MKKLIFPIVALLIMAVSCTKSERKTVTTDVAFSRYVQAFTSGVISSESTISVYMSQPVEGEINTEDLFRFKPEVKGKTVLVGGRIFEFRPDEALKPGTNYKAEFALGKVLKVESKFQQLPFEFATVKQTYSITVEGLRNYEGLNSTQMQLTGYVLTADVADSDPIEKIVTVTANGKDLPVAWNHDSNRRKHFFTVDSIARMQDDAGKVIVKWDGSPLNADVSGTKELEIPALSTFKILEATVVQQPEQYVSVRFSDPLLKTQDLEGLIEMDNTKDLRLEIDGNVVKVWPGKRVSGVRTMNVYEGIKSANYARLKSAETFILKFTNAEPALRLIGKGVIVPENDHLEFPFEAISLNAVDVRLIEIYKDNIAQFLQENRLNGSSELKRVGRLVYEGKVDLMADNPVNYNEWNTFKIDLAKLVKLQQGAVYRVELRFCKEYSQYVCQEDSAKEEIPEISLSTGEDYETEWDAPGWYSDYYYPPGYIWEEQDNPCHVSYYNSDRFVSRNIMASQLGIIAKEGRDHRMLFAVSNLVSTNPEADVELQLYNYQNQWIETIKTDARGFASVDLKKKPFLLVAKKGSQFGYLRLDDGTSLSVSNFNVAGQEITDGMKGFIYGERDVWRPGDTLFVNFILETASDNPENHPAIFSLINPKEQVVERRVITHNENGFYQLTTQTKKDAPTGNWRAEVQVGNSTFSKRVKIETIKPNRLKIELGLPKDKLLGVDDKNLPISASWLHGTPAKSLKAKVEVLFTKSATQFADFRNYTFTDPATRFSNKEETIFDAQLDETGKGTIPLNLEGLDNAPGMLNAWFTSRVFESGGDFSTSVTKALYSPYSTYVGIRMPESEDNWYKTDTEYLPEIVLVDKNGKAASGDDLEVRLYKVNWRWWWESGSESLAHYVSGSYYQPVASWAIKDAKPKSQVRLNVKYNNWQDNGRYFLWVKDNTSGHSAGITFYMSEWGGWRSDGMTEGATMLSIRADKQKYNVGEDIEVIIPSSKTGKALVSLENGTGVLDMFWMETSDKQTRFTIKAKPEMAPNFYVHVSLIQPFGSTENDAPLRLYGVIPVEVENPETILKPVIKAPDEIEPETDYTVEISEANNKKMTYTLAIVDEGLLGLTNYSTPNPHATFYQREALGVKTWDLYDYVAGAYGARLEKAFAVGGDDEMVDSEKKEANRFKPVVQFAGPFTLEAGKKQKHTFKMPNYVGAVRMMVVAGNQGAYGAEEVSVPVRKGLMLLATVPRMLAPLETFDLPVDVFAMKSNVKDVSITVKTNDLFEIVGSKENKLQFTETGEKMSYFKLKVKAQSGVGKIVVEAKSGKEMASYEVEVQVRNPNQAVTVQQSKLVKGGESWNSELQNPGEPDSNEAWVEVSGFPPLNLAKYLDYLIQYPHGCVEQVTSSVFPQLFLANLTTVYADQKLKIETNIRQALIKLQSYQLGSGGFSYWPGSSYANEWGTSYVGHFLVCAENAGYSLPYGMKDKWVRYQKSAARNWKKEQSNTNIYYYRNYDLNQAYRLYTLALAGNPDLGAMNRLREKGSKSPDVLWRLVSAYVLAGKKEIAQQLVAGLSSEVEEYNEMGGTFGSSLRDKAMILESLVLLEEQENAFSMLQEISDDINKSSWLSTQTAAWSLFSAAQFSEKFYKNGSETAYDLSVNGEKSNARTQIPVIKIPVKNGKTKQFSLNYKNTGANATFVRLVAKGIPAGVDSSSAASNLLLEVKYLDAAGKSIDPASIQQGTDFKMEVTVKHPGKKVNYEEMVLSTLVPSGWEILNKRLGDAPQNDANFEYQDIRDDRIYTYFDLEMGKQKTFTFYLNAAYKGEFYLPPASCEAMYDNSVNARLGGKMVTVK
ncbi:Ig-like domain-containing alpha-2-macroglobulin family protein [Maribellus sp. YY47]|uniref:Ig-like domain-containing alpha-2-macroglobulin family protein n=1 Tax=Maribellus sp. YY47 TaxID=2929486 RepID=UPI0020018672|nr:Ig-like domain-containing alpha-2-macroglobulin family protein [Maribellus sp. YY47]MCK3683278.1 MG2 domain-containing protein [Maribellus sp. YY47]